MKHFDANNEEFERHRIDEQIDERALHEIYLPAFKAAVQRGDAWSVMSCYNLVNGHHCAESDYLLKPGPQEGIRLQKLRHLRLGQHLLNRANRKCRNGPRNARRAAAAGVAGKAARTWRQGSSGGWLAADKVLAEVKAGHITEATIDDNVSRILRVIILSGIVDHPHTPGGEIDTPEQQKIALRGATEGIVLLKNQGSLLHGSIRRRCIRSP